MLFCKTQPKLFLLTTLIKALKQPVGRLLKITTHKKTKVKTRKPWENEEIYQKRQPLHQAQLMKESLPSPENIRLFNEARFSLKEAYRDKQKSYLEGKISQIRNSATNKRSAEAWKTVNEITGRKSSNSSKLKAASQEERIQLWKSRFKDLLGKPPQVSNELITPIVQEELNIKKGNFYMEELVKALKSTQNHKACGLDEIPAEVWKLSDFHQILLNVCNSVYNGDSIDRWTEGGILPFPKKRDLSIAKNYRGITLTAISENPDVEVLTFSGFCSQLLKLRKLRSKLG